MGRLNKYSVSAIPKRPNGLCGIESCVRLAKAKGHCILHYDRVKEYGAAGGATPMQKKPRNVPCEVSGCKRPVQGDGLCQMHFARRVKRGHVGQAEPEKNAKGEGTINWAGYRMIKPSKDDKHIMEHRHLMEKKLGRKLRKGENIHHLDGDRLNNDLSNLELWTVQQPAGQRITDKFDWAVKFIQSHPDLAASRGIEIIFLESARANEVLENRFRETTVSEAICGIAGLI